MALVKFVRGTQEQYNTAIANTSKEQEVLDSIFFVTDAHKIMMNGIQYGGADDSVFNGFIKNVDVEGSKLTFQKDVNGKWIEVSIELLKAADKSIVLGNINNSGVTDGSTIKVNVKDVGDNDGLKLGDNGLYVDLTKTNSAITQEVSDRKAAITALSASTIGGDGKYIKSIKEEAGIITATEGELEATAVSYDKNSDKVITAATNVSAAIKELDAKVAANKDAELTYKTVKLSDEEVTKLADANVKEAYKVVSVDKDKVETQVGDTIKIYKDSALESIDFVEENDKKVKGQFLKYVYTLANGSEETVYVDMSALVTEAEVENGIQAVDRKLSIKLNATGADTYLTVDKDGLKLSGVKAAIDTAQKTVQDNLDTEATTARAAEKANKDAITKLNSDAKTEGSVAKAVADAKNSLLGDAANDYNTLGKLEDKIQELDEKATKAHTEVNAKTSGHVTVTVADSKDKTHKVVTVAENDIASESSLNAEIDRAKNAESGLSNSLSTETKARKDADTAISGVVSGHTSEINTLSQKLTDEISNRESGDTKTLKDANDYTDNAISWIDAGVYASSK